MKTLAPALLVPTCLMRSLAVFAWNPESGNVRSPEPEHLTPWLSAMWGSRRDWHRPPRPPRPRLEILDNIYKRRRWFRSWYLYLVGSRGADTLLTAHFLWVLAWKPFVIPFKNLQLSLRQFLYWIDPKNNYVSYFMGHKIKAGFSSRLLIGIISIIMKIQIFLHLLDLTKIVYNLAILS